MQQRVDLGLVDVWNTKIRPNRMCSWTMAMLWMVSRVYMVVVRFMMPLVQFQHGRFGWSGCLM